MMRLSIGENLSSIAKTLAVMSLLLAISTPVSAGVIRVAETDFKPTAGLITFSEFAVNTVNPTYAPGDYGGASGSPTVTFGGFFIGQSLSLNPGADCPGAAASACVVGSPSGGALTLDAASPDTFITTDSATPNSPVLTGTPRFNGAIAILFDFDLAGVGFDAGFFDAVGSTGITAFTRDGSLLGTVANDGLGIEFLGLMTADGTAAIAGVFLDLIGQEPAGFAIDSLRFALEGQIINPEDKGVPEPSVMLIFAMGIGGMTLFRRRRKV